MSPLNYTPDERRNVDELGIQDYEVYPEDTESSLITDPSDLEFIQGFIKSQATKLIGVSRDYDDDSSGIDSKGPKSGITKHLNKAKRALDNLNSLQQKMNMSPQTQQPPYGGQQLPPTPPPFPQQPPAQPYQQAPYYPQQQQPYPTPMAPPQADGAVWFQLIYSEIQKFTSATNAAIGGLQGTVAQQTEVINALTDELKKLRRTEKKTPTS